jgi:hypothetical protein
VQSREGSLGSMCRAERALQGPKCLIGAVEMHDIAVPTCITMPQNDRTIIVYPQYIDAYSRMVYH